MDKETESKAVGVIGNGLIHYPFDFMVCDGKYFHDIISLGHTQGFIDALLIYLMTDKTGMYAHAIIIWLYRKQSIQSP